MENEAYKKIMMLNKEMTGLSALRSMHLHEPNFTALKAIEGIDKAFRLIPTVNKLYSNPVNHKLETLVKNAYDKFNNNSIISAAIRANDMRAKLIMATPKGLTEMDTLKGLMSYNKGLDAFRISGEINSILNKSLGLSTLMKKVFEYNPQFEDLIIEAYEADGASDDIEEPQTNSKIVLVQNKIVQSIYDIYNNRKDIYKIPSREFEELLKELLESKGFSVDMTKQTRDGGYDLIALQSSGGYDHKFLVECKRYSQERKVGISIVRELLHVLDKENANRAMIVTTSTFSRDVIAERNLTPYKLDLHDIGDLKGWITEYYNKY